MLPTDHAARRRRHDIPGNRQCREDREAHDILSGMRRRRRSRDHFRAWLARAVAELASPASVLRRPGLQGHRARHARLRAIERLPAPRGLRRRAHRRGYARAAPGARPREGRLGRPRLGQPHRVEPCKPPPRQMRRRRQPLRSLHCQGLCSREFPAPRRSGGLPRGAVPGRTVGLPAVLRGELRQGAPGLRGRCPQHREGPVPQGTTRRQGQAEPHRNHPQGRWMVRPRRQGPRPADRYRCADGGRPQRLRHRARGQRLLRPGFLVHEPPPQPAVCGQGRQRRQAALCRCSSSTAPTTTPARRWSPAWPSPCGRIARISPRWSCRRAIGWRRKNQPR